MDSFTHQDTGAVGFTSVSSQDRAISSRNINSEFVEAVMAMLARDGMTITTATASIAFEAGRLRATHYDKKACSVSMADCFAAATALLGGAAVATSDPRLVAIMLAEKGKVHPLPDRRGNSPAVA